MLGGGVLAEWQAGLDDMFALIAGRFARVEPRRLAFAYIRGLLAPLERRNGWTIAEHAGRRSPNAVQEMLYSPCWDPHLVRDDVRDYLIEHLGDPAGVLIGDDSPVKDMISRVRAGAWQRMSCGDGAHGPRVYDWAWTPIRSVVAPGRRGWVLARRSISTGEVAYYRCFGRRGTRLRDLVRVAGARWAIEESFQTAKNEVGLDQYQVRRYDAWYAHITLAMAAAAFLVVTRAAEAAKGVPAQAAVS
jgi:SRSO17 transposase